MPEALDLDPTSNKDNIAKGKHIYAVTVGVFSSRALTVARNVKDGNNWSNSASWPSTMSRASRALGQLTELLNQKLAGHGRR